MLKEYDYALFRFFHHELRQPWLDPIAKLITDSGLGQVQFLLCLPTVFFAPTRRLFWRLAIAIIAVGSLAPLAKRVVPRDRPSNLYDSLPMEAYYQGSFPSGHTTSSFAVATVLYLYFRGTNKHWIGKLALIWAACVGLSRCYVGVHWPSDVLAGALLGFAGGVAIHLGSESILARKTKASGIVHVDAHSPDTPIQPGPSSR